MEMSPTFEPKMSSKRTNKPAAATTKRPRRQPLKVVHISSPLKLEASPSEFRALVQELTGKDSDFANSFAKYSSPTMSTASATPSSMDKGKSKDCSSQQEVGFFEDYPSYDTAFESFPMFMPSYNDL